MYSLLTHLFVIFTSFFTNVNKCNYACSFHWTPFYHCQALGNHEFNDGLDHLQDFIESVSSPDGFDVLSSNINNTQEPRLAGYKPYVIKRIGVRKVGIIGYTTVDTPALTPVG